MVLQRHRSNQCVCICVCVYIYIYIIYLENQLMQLKRLRSSTVHHLQVGIQESHQWSCENCRASGVSPSWEQSIWLLELMSQFEQSGREREFNTPLPFHSNQTLKGLDDAHSHWGRLSTLLSLLIQTLISSRHILIDTPRNDVWSRHHVS